MALFKEAQDSSAAEAVPAGTYVAIGSHIEGRISGETEVSIDGSLNGVVDLEGRFAVGRGGRIQGEVTACLVRIAGRVKGNVRATKKIHLASSGSIVGDMAAPLVSIAEGGTSKGMIEAGGTVPDGSFQDVSLSHLGCRESRRD